jgi:5-methylcytosine-specific restriction endonuclease McrA
MRDYAKVGPKFWIDAWGNSWRVVQSRRRLNFCNPSHAALRRHIFHRDGFACCNCGVRAHLVPDGYDGRYTLQTETFVCSGFRDRLLLDHILTLSAGGTNTIDNFQTLCETCNKRKQKEDKANAIAYRTTVQ